MFTGKHETFGKWADIPLISVAHCLSSSIVFYAVLITTAAQTALEFSLNCLDLKELIFLGGSGMILSKMFCTHNIDKDPSPLKGVETRKL